MRAPPAPAPTTRRCREAGRGGGKIPARDAPAVARDTFTNVRKRLADVRDTFTNVRKSLAVARKSLAVVRKSLADVRDGLAVVREDAAAGPTTFTT